MRRSAAPNGRASARPVAAGAWTRSCRSTSSTRVWAEAEEKIMRKVAVIGVGLHRYGKWQDKKPKDLARTAVEGALTTAGLSWKDLQSAWCGHTSLGMTAGARLFAPL